MFVTFFVINPQSDYGKARCSKRCQARQYGKIDVRHSSTTCREAGVITQTDGTSGFLISLAELCNGSTYDSDSYCLGSNPSSAAMKKASFVYPTKALFSMISVPVRTGDIRLRRMMERISYHADAKRLYIMLAKQVYHIAQRYIIYAVRKGFIALND